MFKNIRLTYFILCISILPVCAPHACLVPEEVRRHWIPRTECIEGGEPQCECYQQNLSHLQE